MSSDAPAAQSATSIRGVAGTAITRSIPFVIYRDPEWRSMLGFCVWQYAAINIFFALIWIGIVTVITREHKKLSAIA